ncbi:D-aminoacyl-tRNA deacylase [uncultured Dubosiella sp.]|uniref:D-aminoacyl-tRNA deacylase n=1 Tax=uncultured Dubosiella sp. TaxID=1937011 RepID=UPI0025B2D94C|nr:D-aminoacyl-tRNA deacylase [uncultured Dubosiella sp.]
MKVVLQRVKEASCTIDGETTGRIGTGYMILVGFCDTDTQETVRRMAEKIVKLRVFEDEDGKMNRSLLDVEGEILSISQFTLYANARKGNRPSFIEAAKPAVSQPLYDDFNAALGRYVPVQTGVFGADMKIALINDGPVTIVLDSKEMFA